MNLCGLPSQLYLHGKNYSHQHYGYVWIGVSLHHGRNLPRFKVIISCVDMGTSHWRDMFLILVSSIDWLKVYAVGEFFNICEELPRFSP